MNSKRGLPSVSRLLENESVKRLIVGFGREHTVRSIREHLDGLRGQGGNFSEGSIASAVEVRLRLYSRTGPRRVINATGVLVHTNLGRAVLSENVLNALREALTGYSDLEFDLEKGARGKRARFLEEKLVHITGGEAALAVNNNAAALLLAVNTFALNREVVVSRGELVEIGGSFRLPEIIRQAGGILREVGTTNRTRLSDYERAAGKNAGLLLKVHPSNFSVTGFTEETPVAALAALGKRCRIPVLHDVGSGLLAPGGAWGLPGEPDPIRSLKEGAGLVSMSADKLLGGPQAGLVIGKHSCVEAMKKNPMMRALRIGKLTLAALEASLIPYFNPSALTQIPLFRQLSETEPDLRKKARRLAKRLAGACRDLAVALEKSSASVGGGAQPATVLPSYSLLLSHPRFDPDSLRRKFLGHRIPIAGVYLKGKFSLNVRALLPGDEKEIAALGLSL